MEDSAEAAAPPAEEAPPPAEEAAEEPPPRELLPHEVAQQKADAARATLNRNVAHRASLGMLGADIFNEQKTVDAELEAQNAKKPKKAKQAGGQTLRERLGRGAKYAYAVVFPYLHERAMARQPATGKTPLMMVMSALKMTKRDAARFLRLFEKIDSNHSGTIDIEEFFDYLRTDISGYTRKAFAMMEIKTEEMGQHGEIDAAKARALAKKERQKARRVKKRGGTYVKNIELHYAEFFVALFNFLTLTNERIVRFTFDLIDEDKSGYLSQGRGLRDGDGDVEFEEFYRVHCKLSSLMFPAFRLRRILRIKCMGNRFWRRCEKNREKIQKATGAAPASPRATRRAAARSPAVGKSPLEIYKDIIESNQNAAFELAEAERLAEEARHAHDAST
ncbi:calcium:sodium antiporter [Aureococcus anophagefferens]|nr:calcium:sodium antiporter [Aureococcus anophagefferens]